MRDQAAPRTHVAYWREAWVSEHDNALRVTFDRVVQSSVHLDTRITTEMIDAVQPWGDLVILELKFTGRCPQWFSGLVRTFGVMQCGVAKYAEGVEMLGETRLQATPGVVDEIAEREFQRRRARNRRLAEDSPRLEPSAANSVRPGY